MSFTDPLFAACVGPVILSVLVYARVYVFAMECVSFERMSQRERKEKR